MKQDVMNMEIPYADNQPKDNMPPCAPKIYGALAGVIADVGAVAKDKINKQQGFKFRSIDDVYNALHPALAKNKVVIVPTILEQTREIVGKTQKGSNMTQVICKIRFNFYAEDGSSVEAVIIGEGMDTGDKATNKAMAIAYKYACFQVFCIPTEEMVDPDSESLEEEMQNPAKQRKGKSSGNKTQKQEKEYEPAEQGAYQEDNASAYVPEFSQEEVLSTDTITSAMLQTIRAEQKRTGIADQVILNRKGVKAKTIEELTIEEFKSIMRIFEKTPDKKGGANE